MGRFNVCTKVTSRYIFYIHFNLKTKPANAVYNVPLGTSVRLEGGEFLALSRSYRDRIEAVLTSSDGQREDQVISPSNPLFEKFGCDQIGVQLMEVPENDADSVLVLYTVERVTSDECDRFWN